MKKLILLAMFLFLLVMPLTIAQVVPFQQPTFLEGFTIKYPANGVIQQGEDYQFNFHIFNTSNGVPIVSGVECHFHLYNDTGEHQLSLEESTFSFDYDIAFNVSGGNFSELGEYSYLIQCNSSTQGGYDSIPFSITPTGGEITESQGIVAIGLIFMIMLLVGLFAFLSSAFWESEQLFPIALFFMLISCILGVYSLHLGYLFSRDILFLLAIENTQFVIYFGVMWGLIGMGLLGMVFLTVKALKEFKERKSIQRYGEGWDPKDRIYK